MAAARKRAGARQGRVSHHLALCVLFALGVMHLCVECMQLCLWPCRLDTVTGNMIEHPGRAHVEALWRMKRERRLRLWEALGRYTGALEALELGSCNTLDDDELRVMLQRVLPPRLDSMQSLFLGFLDELTDSGIQALAEVGCGKNLTSLNLNGVCQVFISFFSSPALRRRLGRSADLPVGVTDASFEALAAAGCGEYLTLLDLSGERVSFSPTFPSLSGRMGRKKKRGRRHEGGCDRRQLPIAGGGRLWKETGVNVSVQWVPSPPQISLIPLSAVCHNSSRPCPPFCK